MLELSGCVCLGVDVGNFLELDGSLPAECAVVTSADEEEVLAVLVAPGHFLVKVGILNDLGDDVGNLSEQIGIMLQLGVGNDAAFRGKPQRHHQHNGNLAGVGLGGGNGDFGTGPCIKHDVRFAGDGGTNHIDNGNGGDAAFFGYSQSCQCVGGFSALGDDHDRVALLKEQVGIPEFRSDLRDDRNLCNAFDHVSAHHAGVKCAAAGNDVQTLNLGNVGHFLCKYSLRAVFQAGKNGIGKHFGLLIDFLEHEVIVAALFRSRNIPRCCEDFLLNRLSVRPENIDGTSRDDGKLIFL